MSSNLSASLTFRVAHASVLRAGNKEKKAVRRSTRAQHETHPQNAQDVAEPRRPNPYKLSSDMDEPHILAGRMRIKAYRREAISQQRISDMEEEAKHMDLEPSKMLKKGDPSTVQAVIRDIIPVGYYVTIANGKEGFLPSTDLGFSGGVAVLQRLFKVGQEISVRVVRVAPGGRQILSIKKGANEEAG